jgi:protoheme IX farnesyltransferase
LKVITRPRSIWTSTKHLVKKSRYAGAVPNIKLIEDDANCNDVNDVNIGKKTIFLRKLPKMYLQLSKYRLTGLVVLTAMAGYAISPAETSVDTLLWLSLGTGLCAGSANAINQILEVPYDSRMGRTKNRLLVRDRISVPHAMAFAAVIGLSGVTVLACLVNPLTSFLGGFNLLLYTAVYTPLKRYTIANTWIGSIVGAIPPMMGWAGAMGSLGVGSWVLGGLLFSWQLVHFHSLSWSLKGDYGRGGYKMAASVNPSLCRRSTFRHSLALIPMCTMAPLLDVTTWWFALDSLPLNCWFAWKSWQFYEKADNKSARSVFQLSLFYLPALLCLMIINKKNLQSIETDDKGEHEDCQTSLVEANISSGIVQAVIASDHHGTEH